MADSARSSERAGDTRLADTESLLLADLTPIWVAALGALLVVGGYVVTRAALHATGHSGRAETLEWGTYLLFLICFPAGVAVLESLLPKRGMSLLAQKAKWVLIAALTAGALVCVIRAGVMTLAAGMCAAAVSVGAYVVYVARRERGSISRKELTILFIASVAAWIASSGLVSWTRPAGWFAVSPVRALILLAVAVLATLGLSDRSSSRTGEVTSAGRRISEGVAVLILVALSFRTYPVLELYHWQAYVGPADHVRQGGLLLWDVASQYGILPILVPAMLPGSSWQSFYLFQAVLNAIVAVLFFRQMRLLHRGWANLILALLVAATTIFFRPRSATLILAGQMTPSGGPVRFVWAFAMLSFLTSQALRVRQGRPTSRSFVLWGSLIWIASLLWSVESGIYAGGVWLPGLIVYLVQAKRSTRHADETETVSLVSALSRVMWPLGLATVTALLISVVYHLATGFGPDWVSYLEYALLYTGGFGALPIAPTGGVWFLLIALFAMVSGLVLIANGDLYDPAIVATAGAFGGAWATSSYFVSRSHPANLLSITPFILFCATTVLLFTPRALSTSGRLLSLWMVPIFAAPVALTLSHPGFFANLRARQLSYGSFTEQIPFMEPSLNDLLLKAGARIDDPVVRIGDGRLMLPAWRPSVPGAKREISRYSWLPKQYELIGGLPPARRQTYIERNARHLALSGWLVDTRRPGILHHDEQLAQIRQTHRETRRFENDDWIVAWYELLPG